MGKSLGNSAAQDISFHHVASQSTYLCYWLNDKLYFFKQSGIEWINGLRLLGRILKFYFKVSFEAMVGRSSQNPRQMIFPSVYFISILHNSKALLISTHLN